MISQIILLFYIYWKFFFNMFIDNIIVYLNRYLSASTPWFNWSYDTTCFPQKHYYPETLNDIINIIKDAKKIIKK